VDHPSTEVMPQEDAAVSALDATACVDTVADDDVKVKAVHEDNEPDNSDSIRDSYVVAMSSDVRKTKGRGRRKVILGSTDRHVLPARKGRKAVVIRKTPTRVPKSNSSSADKKGLVKKNSTKVEETAETTDATINVNELDFWPSSPPTYLFVFSDKATGEEKLDAVLSSKFVTEKEYADEIAFYVLPDKKDFPILYKDFTKHRDKLFSTTHVVSGFFRLMDIQFRQMMNNQRFADCSLWSNYVSKHDKCSPEKLLAAIKKYIIVSQDQVLYIPCHLTNHFMLIVVVYKQAIIEVYDSLDFDHKKEIDQLMACLQSACFDEDIKWDVRINCNHNIKNFPWQSDGYSCAYFTCWYAYIHAMNGEIPEFPNDVTISDIAKGILISLIDRKLYDKLLYVY
jgi:Ulp1 family protease